MSGAVLVGDIGGTNVRLASAHRNGDALIELDRVEILPGDDFQSFEHALRAYIGSDDASKYDGALFAIAGPVRDNVITMTNRDWHIDGNALAGALGLNSVTLKNDYAAMARAIPELPGDCFEWFHKGNPPENRAPILVSGPGTGLGVATLLPRDTAGWRVLTGEGGHAAYAPRTVREWALTQSLRATHGYVSKELVLSGSGMDAVHKALCEIDGVAWVKTSPQEIMKQPEAGPGIARDICEIRSRATLEALGDAALIAGTTGGVVITGGVAERLADWLRTPDCLARFFERGPKSSYMSNIPIRLLRSSEAALIGAAALYYDEETSQ